MKRPKRVRRKARFIVGQVVALRILNDGITEYGIVCRHDTQWQYAYGVQLSSQVGITWRPARDLRPLTAKEIGPRR